MNRSRLVNLLLLLAAGVLGFAVWQIQQSDRPARLTELSTSEVTRIDISGLSGRSITLTKQNGAWWLDKAPANSDRIAELLRICETPSLVHFAAPAELTPFGLARPQILLKLNQESLSFGGTDPVNGWRYVSYQGQVHLIADGFYHHLAAPAEVWLERP